MAKTTAETEELRDVCLFVMQQIIYSESCEWLLVHLCASLDRVTHMYHLQSDKDTAYNLDLAL